jgi:hypothetical protein
MRPMNDENAERIAVAVLAKAPLPGLAKTRLIPLLGESGAAALQRWLLHRAVATAVVADVGPVMLWCAPDTQHADFNVCRAFGPVSLHRQPDGDLGRRMLAAINESPSRTGTLLIGTDCPLLTPGLLRHAAEMLRERDAVVMPAEDGGYVLIGMREAAPRVFNGIEWGSRHVMAQTRRALDATCRQWTELDTLWDVDRDEDFARLARIFPDVLEFEVEPRHGAHA